MPYQIFPTTAEEIIAAMDAIIQTSDGASAQLIADFLATSVPNAENAADMAVELSLARKNGNAYFPLFPYSTYLVTSSPWQKAAILRLILEQYEPFKQFKNRLVLNNTAQDAATQIRAVLGITAHAAEIRNTLVSLGTYSSSLKTEGAGRFTPNVEPTVYQFISLVEEVIHNRATAELMVRARLGDDVSQWIDNPSVLDPLITAFQKSANAGNDTRAPIVHAGNAFESFLVQVANHYGVNLAGAHGINSKMNRIRAANHLSQKLKGISVYLGDVRNAADHGVDPDIGAAWDISSETGLEYVQISIAAIKAIYNSIHGRFVI